MSKCKHLILIWVKTGGMKLAQFSWNEELYKCTSCDRLFTIKELKEREE